MTSELIDLAAATIPDELDELALFTGAVATRPVVKNVRLTDGSFRGWTCRRCDWLIRRCNDSAELIHAIADYKERVHGNAP